ncbi:protein D2-like [Stylophora pistillata]|uniref:Phosphatidylethanolamine-binding protein 4 n=1 Tax=Stylophora pistillata TaxID=50429 RepID=A0A2B4SRC9_STYPI|nr:protein D2-like [Stylophora pistillata]PFX31047.1 Phosphatidylethanolamine-binding protein 4 [Stylophora pistillata]
MAYGKYQLVVLIFLLLGFSFVYSSLIEYSCQTWGGYGDFSDVTFGDQPSLTETSCGKEVELKTFSDSPPRVRYSQAVSAKKYLIAMIDPDAPSRESHSCRSWLHWIVGNIKGKNLEHGDIMGDTFTGYNPPTPPSGSGPHRYYLYVFEQKHPLDIEAEVVKRCQFSIDDYKQNNDLTPVAMNMFQTVNNS